MGSDQRKHDRDRGHGSREKGLRGFGGRWELDKKDLSVFLILGEELT